MWHYSWPDFLTLFTNVVLIFAGKVRSLPIVLAAKKVFKCIGLP